jgi:mitofusin
MYGLGIGLALQYELLETNSSDIFDFNHYFLVHFGDGKEGEEDSATPTALGILSIGVGFLTMVGGQAIGLRGLIEGVVHVTDLLGRKWAAPVLGTFTIGMAAYLIIGLPDSIPRTVGRRVKASILSREREVNFVEAHAARVARETRKVLRLASWDLKERYRGAMEARAGEVMGAEQKEKKALKAKEWFTNVGERAVKIEAEAELQNIGA